MGKNLTTGSVFRTIVTFALPYLLSYFLQTLYGMADLFIAGQFIGIDGITAVANGSQVLYMLTVVIVGLAMGATVTIGRAVGANRLDRAAKAIGNVITLFAGIALALTVVLLLNVHNIISLIGVPVEAVEGTAQYLTICYIGIPFFIAHLDVMGLLLFSITISALLIVLMSLPTFDKVSGCVTVIALLAFVAWELHAATPFVDVRSLAADSAMTLNFLRAMLTMLGAYVVMYALPQWLEDACHMNAGVSGMFIIPMGVVATVASLSIAKKPIVRLPLMVCCSAMVAVGMLLACTSSAGMVVLPLTASAVAGLVLGLSMSTSQTVLYRRAASEHIGTSSGLLRTSIYIGSIGASSLSGVFFGETVTDGGLHGIGITVAVLGVAALLATVMDRTLR